MKERELQTKVIEASNYLGLRHFHTFDVSHRVSGYPNITIVGPGGVIFCEVKGEKGRVTPQQQAWLKAINDAGTPAFLVRPHDFPALQVQLRRLAGQ